MTSPFHNSTAENMAYDLEEQEQLATMKAWWNRYGSTPVPARELHQLPGAQAIRPSLSKQYPSNWELASTRAIN